VSTSTPDAVGIMLNIVQSGVVVSGNSFITVARSMTSGDALSSFRVSGPTDLIAIRLTRNITMPLLGGRFNKVEDYVDAEIWHHDVTANASGVISSSGSVAIVQKMVNDFKVTISGGTWSGVPPPQLVSEVHPYAQQQFAKGRLTYRVQYLL
jgi:hypothetical protein